MKYKKFDNTYVVRIEKGEEVISKLTDLCNKESIKLGSIAGIGATDKLVIGLFDTNSKQYHKTTLTGPMEITSLMGNVSTKDGETYLHIHINVCNADMQVYGGHLNECYISATCELHVTKIDGEVDRYFDESIGLNLYKL